MPTERIKAESEKEKEEEGRTLSTPAISTNANNKGGEAGQQRTEC